MESAYKLALWIGTFGFLKEFRPEDPYITQYLVGPVMNLSKEQVNEEVFPIATYVSTSQLILVFLLTDWLLYKPVVLVNALSGVISQAILIWGRGLKWMQVMEIFYGTMIACEVAYYTYIYAKVEKQHFQLVTSFMRAACLCGRFLSSISAQIFLLTGIMTIATLNHLTFGGMMCAFLWALTLPPVKHSLYFHRQKSAPKDVAVDLELDRSEEPRTLEGDVVESSKSAFEHLWFDFKFAYRNPYVLKWSLWWSLATCGYNQVTSYNQLLWEEVQSDGAYFNGAVEAVYTIISAGASVSIGYLVLDWSEWGELLLGICTLLEGFFLIGSSFATSILPCYFAYVAFGMLYHVMMTISNSEVAKHIRPDSYALIFGVNQYIALCLQSLLTYVVADKLALNSRPQFIVYGSYFIILGFIFFIKFIHSKGFKIRHRKDYSVS
ncbi:unnamed protein product [Bemisia tabaci]|uniref:Reduced folate carrier n=1 Tax=Bemisia tabaci TaxID=7038 RepID=A0A9P0A694_BEMTA|nr:unnamed protein product [Bemisia tabaci]